MKSVVRLLLVWLLALALPTQGVAAVMMQFCGPGHQSQTALLETAQADHSMHGAAQAQAADAGVEPAPSHHGAALGKYKCSACAACCMATALPSTVTTVPVVKPVIERAIVEPAAYVGPDTSALERPPRHDLA